MEMATEESPFDNETNDTGLLVEKSNRDLTKKRKEANYLYKTGRFILQKISIHRSLGLCVIVIIGLLCVIIFRNSTKKDKRAENLCLGKDCILAATLLLQNMDETVDPCDNFYKFTCGGYIRKQNSSDSTDDEAFAFSEATNIVAHQLNIIFTEPISPEEQKAYKLAKSLHQSCMNLTSVEEKQVEMKRVLKLLGEWPLLEGRNWTDNSFSWTETIYKFRKYGFPTDQLFKLSLGIGSDNESYVLQIDQPSFPIDKSILTKGLADSVVNSYYTIRLEWVRLLLLDTSYSSSDIFTLELMDAARFEIELSTILNALDNQTSNTESGIKRTNIISLNKLYPSIPWKTYIKSLVNITGIEITGTTDIDLAVTIPEYLSKLELVLSTTDTRKLANYLMSKAAYAVINIWFNIVKESTAEISAIFSATSSSSPRWRGCADAISKYMPDATGSLYTKRYFQKSTSSKVTEIVEDVKNGFLTNFKENDEIDYFTSEKVMDEVSSLKPHIGYMEEFVNETELNYYYDDERLAFPFEASYLTNVLTLLNHKENKKWSKIGKQKSENVVWASASPTDINAYSVPGTNAIYIPAGILQGYFFNPNRPSFMNYGALGWVVGHETIHSLEDTKIEYVPNQPTPSFFLPDNLRIDSWSVKNRCFANQYANYPIPGIQFQEGLREKAGYNARSENIADNGGIQAAYTAYQLWVRQNGMEKKLPGLNSYTQNQLFWLSAANVYCGNPSLAQTEGTFLTDSHAIMEFRVNGAFSNMKKFSQDFKCPLQSRMNPISKCNLW